MSYRTYIPVNLPIYLDHHSTTPVDPRVLETMLPYFTEQFGNAASRTHTFGQRALEAVEKARAQLAALINASPKEIIFTSGATESNNLALIGYADANAARGKHIVTTNIEHKAILDTCKYLETRSCAVTYVPVASTGRVDPSCIEETLRPDTLLITVMHANNEIGTVQPLTEIGAVAAKHHVPFHVDAAQAAGRLFIDVKRDNIAMLSLSAHKFYGPKGVGALYVRRKAPYLKLTEQIHGGGHERGLRSGTLNVPAIVGMGKAAEIAKAEMEEETARTRALRDHLLHLLQQSIPDLCINGTMEHRLPNNLNVSFPHVEGESLIMSMRDVAVSSGSACTSAQQEPSYVLRATGTSNELAHASIRFGLGRFNTKAEIEFAAARVIDTVQRLREISPGYSAK